ncbi:MAG: adenylate/guanylate cyclase domain-containing protein [Deltaproteobacteria bacterium]|nr:adenylate/guanylate cyclase domain-containing protein [Deltaproteobacteria bacterium]
MKQLWKLIKPGPWKITAGIIALALIGYFILLESPYSLPLLHQLELKSIDFRFRARGTLKKAEHVAVVSIDDESLERYGRWPWNRNIIARLVEKLGAAGASTIAFDIVFTQPDPFGSTDFLESIIQAYPASPDSQFLAYLRETLSAKDPDANLSLAISSAPSTVLGYFFFFRPEEIPASLKESAINDALIKPSALSLVIAPAGIKITGADSSPPPGLLVAAGAMNTTEKIAKGVPHHGYFDAYTDMDGNIRRTNLLISFRGNLYPSLALKAASLHADKPIGAAFSTLGVKSIFTGNLQIPTDDHGRFLINYRGGIESIPHLSAADILDDRFDPEFLKGKVAFIGVTAKGMGDILPTPFAKHYPGVFINANITDNLIARDFLVRPPGLEMVELAVLIFGALLFAMIIRFARARTGALLTLLSLSGLLYADFQLLFSRGYLATLSLPILEMGLLYLSLTVYKYFAEERRSRQIKKAFQHYLSPVIVNQLIKNPEALRLGGEEKIVTVLFSDIRNFTSISESMKPEQVTHLLNHYLTEMTDIILTHKGMLDKYVGDEIMALYSVPLPQAGHQILASRTAISMIRRLRELWKEWDKIGYPPLNIGVGIHTGNVYVGNMGSKSIFDYTAIGDSINLGSRLEGTNKEYGTNIILSEATYEGVKEVFICRELDFIRVRGKKEPTRIYELISEEAISPLDKEVLDLYAAGLSLYRNRKWDEAYVSFEQAVARKSTDKPSQLFLERCALYSRTPPPSDWDGVFVMTTK